LIDNLEALAAPPVVVPHNTAPQSFDRPGDDFAAKTTWNEILEPHGWIETSAGKYQHPTATHELSATVDVCKGEDGGERFYCFSDRAPGIEPNKCYTKFALYAALNHDNDYRAAADDLRMQGYGKQDEQSTIDMFASRVVFDRRTETAFGRLPDGTYAPVESGKYKKILSHEEHRNSGKILTSNKLTDSVRTLAAIAEFDNPHEQVHLRVAQNIIDQGEKFIVVDCDGWQVKDSTDVCFTRPRSTRPLPMPKPGGTFDDMKSFVNVPEEVWLLYVAWCVATHFDIPCPVLVIVGEHGSGKSCTIQRTGEIIDNRLTIKRNLPSKVQDIFVAATNAHMLAFDNASRLKQSQSDAFCVLSTGGGYATRQLFTDADEVIMDVQRPVILGSRVNLVTECDLISRSIMIEPNPLVHRKTEEEMSSAWEEAKGCIYGGLLDLVSKALRELPHIHLDTLPRMADFAKIGYAIGGQEFLDQYNHNIENMLGPQLSHPLVEGIIDILAEQPEWVGTPKQLADKLDIGIDASTLSRDELKKFSPILRTQGITWERGKSGKRTITLRKEAASE